MMDMSVQMSYSIVNVSCSSWWQVAELAPSDEAQATLSSHHPLGSVKRMSPFFMMSECLIETLLQSLQSGCLEN